MTRTHVFPDDGRRLICEEVLYVSNPTVVSPERWPPEHEHNQGISGINENLAVDLTLAGAQKVGNIVTDFTKLRENGDINPLQPEDTKGKKKGKSKKKAILRDNVRLDSCSRQAKSQD